jgi:hypothetical protein
MMPSSSRKLRVALIIETSSSYGRRIRRGIRRYTRTHQSWSIFDTFKVVLGSRSLKRSRDATSEAWFHDCVLNSEHSTALFGWRAFTWYGPAAFLTG